MKKTFGTKIISIILSATVLVSTLSVVTMLSATAESSNTQEKEYYKISLFESETFYTDSGNTTQWVGIDQLSSALTFSRVKWDGSKSLYNCFSGAANFLSQPILTYNTTNGYKNVQDTSVENFEWKFTAQSVGGSSRADATEAYFFHVDTSDSAYRDDYKAIFNYDGTANKSAGLANIKDCFAVVYSRQGSTDGLKAQALTVYNLNMMRKETAWDCSR